MTRECSELGLECFVQREIAVDEPRSGGRGAELRRRRLCRGDHARVSREVQIVRAGEHETLAAVDPHARRLASRDAPHAAVERALPQRLELRRELHIQVSTLGNWLK